LRSTTSLTLYSIRLSYNLNYAQNRHPERWSRSADAVGG